jgi:hypothetical protein
MAETFILSFSLPNFHFHAVTAYDILRSRGVPIGKRDYERRPRTRAGSTSGGESRPRSSAHSPRTLPTASRAPKNSVRR